MLGRKAQRVLQVRKVLQVLPAQQAPLVRKVQQVLRDLKAMPVHQANESFSIRLMAVLMPSS